MKKQPTQEELVKLAENGGNDASLLLYDKVVELEGEIETIKEEISKDPPEDIKIEKIASRLAAKMSISAQDMIPTDEQFVSLITPLISPLIPPPIKGDAYNLTQTDKQEIAQLVPVVKVDRVVETIIKEQPIVTEITKVTNEIREVAIPQSPDETVDKVNASNKTIQQDRIENLQKDLRDIKDIALANSTALPITTSFINGKRAKNFQFNGATVSVIGDTAFITTSSGSGHTIQDEGTPLTQRTNLNFVGAGVTVTDDAGNDATKVTISTSAGAGFQAPTSGSIDGSNVVFVWATAPNAIVVDGVSMQKTASDTTVNWTGTTTITLSVAPNFDIYGVA